MIVEKFRMAARKTKVIPHGNYIRSYPNTITKGEARSILGVDDKAFMYLCFGTVKPYKGIDRLLDVFDALKLRAAVLLIAGNPGDEEIKKHIEDRVRTMETVRTVIEYVPDNDIQIYMNAADVVLLPFSDIFTSGSVILAQSFSKPVIAPSIGSIPEGLDSDGGFIFEPRDEGLKRVVVEAYEAGATRLEKMGKNNFDRANKLDWKSIAASTKELYNSCLKGR